MLTRVCVPVRSSTSHLRRVLSLSVSHPRCEFHTPNSWTMTTTISVRVEFGGGLELLFSKQKSHTVEIPARTVDDKRSDVKELIHWLKDNLLQEREGLFLEGDTVYVLHKIHSPTMHLMDFPGDRVSLC